MKEQNYKKGSALVYVMVLLAFSAIFGLGALSIAEHNTVMSENEYNYEQAYLSSESGLQFINDKFANHFDTSGLDKTIEGMVLNTPIESNESNGVKVTLTLVQEDPIKIKIESKGIKDGKSYITTSYAIKKTKPDLRPINSIGKPDSIKFDKEDGRNLWGDIKETMNGSTTDNYLKPNKVKDEASIVDKFKEDHALSSDVNKDGIKELKNEIIGNYDDACLVKHNMNGDDAEEKVINYDETNPFKVKNVCTSSTSPDKAYVFLDPYKDDGKYEIEISNLVLDVKDAGVKAVYVYTYEEKLPDNKKIAEVELAGTIKVKQSDVQLFLITFSKLQKIDDGKLKTEGLEIEEEDGYVPNIDGWVIAPNTKVEVENDKLMTNSPISGGIIAGSIEVEMDKDDGNLNLNGNIPSPRNYLDDIINSIMKPNSETTWAKKWEIKYE